MLSNPRRVDLLQDVSVTDKMMEAHCVRPDTLLDGYFWILGNFEALSAGSRYPAAMLMTLGASNGQMDTTVIVWSSNKVAGDSTWLYQYIDVVSGAFTGSADGIASTAHFFLRGGGDLGWAIEYVTSQDDYASPRQFVATEDENQGAWGLHCDPNTMTSTGSDISYECLVLLNKNYVTYIYTLNIAGNPTGAALNMQILGVKKLNDNTGSIPTEQTTLQTGYFASVSKLVTYIGYIQTGQIGYFDSTATF